MKKIEELTHRYYNLRSHWWGRLWLWLRRGRRIIEIDYQQVELRMMREV